MKHNPYTNFCKCYDCTFGSDKRPKKSFMNEFPHIPCDAIEKTEYVFCIAPYFKELAPKARFFVFDGKVHSVNSNSLYNGKNWHDFCQEITERLK